MKISAFVVSYNREHLIEACLASLNFADEVILIDKSSSDGTRDAAAKWVDRIVTVPWSPASGDTAAYALTLCQHEWIVALCDDECLNVPAIEFIAKEVQNPRADIYLLPRKDYVLGRFDETAYYWPEWQPQFYRKSSFAYKNTIHGAAVALSENEYRIPIESGSAIIHLCHESVEQWIEKTNRYTSQRDRIRTYSHPSSALQPFAQPDSSLRAFAHEAIDFWLSRSPDGKGSDYTQRVGLLRAIYDLVDRVKELEENDNIDGRALYRSECDKLLGEYAILNGTDRRRVRPASDARLATETQPA